MAEKISVEIALEGGDEVERQLADIGSKGQQAFGDIQSAAEGVDLSSFADQIDGIQKAVQGAAGLERIVQGFARVEGAFSALGNAAEKMATRLTRSLGVFGTFARALGPVGIALGVAGAAFLKFGDNSADAISKLTSEGAKIGLTAQQLDIFQQAFGRLGVAPDAVNAGLQRFAETVGGNVYANLQRFIEQLERMPDSVQRTQLAMNLLGESLGGQVIAGLQTGAISAEKFASALRGISPLTKEQVAEANRYEQAVNQLNAAWTELKKTVVPITTPIFQFVAAELRQFRIDLTGFIADIKTAAIFLTMWKNLLGAKSGEESASIFKKAAEDIRAVRTEAANAIKALTQGSSAATQTLLQETNMTIQATQQLGQAGAQAAQQYQTGLFDIGGAVRELGQQGVQSGRDITEGMQAGAQAIRQVESTARTATNALRAMGMEAAMWSRAAFGEGAEAQAFGGSSGGRFASGGLIGGRGTGTSDSNLAWVSRGEHIMPARAVQQPGMLRFLEALRRSGGNLRGVLDGMERFARGGLVPRSIPAFAAGGLNTGGSSSRVLHLTIGNETFHNLSVPENTALSLERFAVHSQIASTGRKPSWRR